MKEFEFSRHNFNFPKLTTPYSPSFYIPKLTSPNSILQIVENVSFEIFNFGILHEFLSPQNVNVARFARNVECDFFCDFQTL